MVDNTFFNKKRELYPYVASFWTIIPRKYYCGVVFAIFAGKFAEFIYVKYKMCLQMIPWNYFTDMRKQIVNTNVQSRRIRVNKSNTWRLKFKVDAVQVLSCQRQSL